MQRMDLHRIKETALSSIQSKINECSNELESMKEQTICVKMLIEEFALALESGVKKTVEVAGERMKQWCGRLESRKTELVELRNKVIEGFKSREEELVRKEKLMEGVVAEIEAKEKQLSNLFDEHRNKQQPETAKELLGATGCYSTSPDSFVSEPKSQPCLTDIAVSTVTFSSDPARMTFHLLEQLFARPVTDITAVRDRILFLEQFMAVSQTVGPELKEEAKELAATWRGNLSHCSSTDDVLAYLLFLAAFGISSYFKAEDTLELVPVIAHSERAPELCRSIGLAKCIPGLIANLCKKNKHMDAFRFSLAFDMVKDCPPDLILRDHLKKTKIFEYGRDLLESQHQALNTHLDSLKALSQGVARLGHNPGSLIGMISYHLEVLDKKLEKKRVSLLAAGVVIKSPNQNVHHLGGTTVSGHNNSPVNSTGEELRNKRQKH
ncbi:FRIGIDA-like protein 5 [Linum grandiflorum]